MSKKDKNLIMDNDATKKLLGYDYQKLIALEKCLDAKPNEYIWIECKGDVADQKTSTEVKHHLYDANLSSNSPDVWKTLKNYVENITLTEEFNYLVLHTTSKIIDKSIFYGWNELPFAEKRMRLVTHEPSSSIKEFHNTVKTCPEKNLNSILKKFTIYSGQPKIQQKWNELKQHASFIVIREEYRNDAVELLYGYITKCAIENSDKWHININDFRRDMGHALSKFAYQKEPFRVISKEELNPENIGRSFVFTQKMADVGLREKEQQTAMFDYLRAQASQLEMLKRVPLIIKDFMDYDIQTEQQINDEKAAESYNISKIDIFKNITNDKSRKVYMCCINKAHDQINGVSNTQRYYRNGRIHNVVETTDFEWKYNEGDL